MPRKSLQRTPVFPYHVTARTNTRESFPVPIDCLWEIIAEEGQYQNMVYGLEIQAFVLMPNHFHMILTVPEFDLGIVMNHFMKSVSSRTNLKSGRSGHLFGGPYHWSLIQNARYFGHALKYVYRNPVRAALCPKVEDYPYSTLHGLVGRAHLPFPIFFSRTGMEAALPSPETSQQLNWLNRPFPTEAEALIKKGLRQKLFDQILDRKSRTTPDRLNALI